ncbi:MAG: type II toxin-antitoxin system VapC family toxin [Candidatus Helarchaeota archaeon]|nr:type II toxin-antitoxin system VapC family toxin [Candidatus Helarchaeota archaeon]
MKVYLDTSVISALFDSKNPERQSLTKSFFNDLEKYELYISEITVIEIERVPDIELQNKMREYISKFTILSLTEEIEWLASLYVQKDAIPEKFSEDAFHIAIAVIHEMDFLLSWNFRHIVKRKTKDIVRMVNTLNNLKQIEIMTPPELL